MKIRDSDNPSGKLLKNDTGLMASAAARQENAPAKGKRSPLISYVVELDRGGQCAAHHHPVGQLLAIEKGSIVVTADSGTFVIPKERAAWIPPAMVHSVRHLASTRMHALLIEPEYATNLPACALAIPVTPLLDALLKAFSTAPDDYELDTPYGRLASVLMDQIKGPSLAQLSVRLPTALDLRTIAEEVLAYPDREVDVERWASRIGVSVRTLERRFAAATGNPLRNFRQQARLMKALELLSGGLPVAEVSDALGFQGPSAFIAMFKNAFGVSPGKYHDMSFATPVESAAKPMTAFADLRRLV